MKEKDYYLANLDNPSALDFKDANLLEPSSIDTLADFGLPKGNTVAFKGVKGMLLGSICRYSSDEKFLEIASLFGSVRLVAGGLDLKKKVGLIVETNDGFYQCIATFEKKWMPVYPASKWKLKALELDDGLFEPIFNTVATRGQDGASYQHYVWLPAAPSQIKELGEVAEMESSGKRYLIRDERVASAVVKGTARWVLPNEEGVFVFSD